MFGLVFPAYHVPGGAFDPFCRRGGRQTDARDERSTACRPDGGTVNSPGPYRRTSRLLRRENRRPRRAESVGHAGLPVPVVRDGASSADDEDQTKVDGLLDEGQRDHQEVENDGHGDDFAGLFALEPFRVLYDVRQEIPTDENGRREG